MDPSKQINPTSVVTGFDAIINIPETFLDPQRTSDVNSKNKNTTAIIHGWLLRLPHIGSHKINSLKSVDRESTPFFLISERGLIESRRAFKVITPKKRSQLAPPKHSFKSFVADEYEVADHTYFDKSFLLRNHKVVIQVEGSQIDSDCETCHSSGKIKCTACKGLRKTVCDSCEQGKTTCQNCNGNGQVNNIVITSEWQECPSCRLSATLALWSESTEEEKTCILCLGTKRVRTEVKKNYPLACGICNSTGRVACEKCEGTSEIGCGRCKCSGKIRCGKCDGLKSLQTHIEIECKRSPRIRLSIATNDQAALDAHRLLTEPLTSLDNTYLSTDLERVFLTHWYSASNARNHEIERQLVEPKSFIDIHRIGNAKARHEFEENGLTNTTLAVLIIVPLLYVANSDGSIDDKEKQWLIDQVCIGNDQFKLELRNTVLNWIDSPLLLNLFYLWSLTIIHVRSTCSQEALNALSQRILESTKEIAKCSSDLPFESKTSNVERIAIHVINSLFTKDQNLSTMWSVPAEDAETNPEEYERNKDLAQLGIKPREKHWFHKELAVVSDRIQSVEYLCSGYGVNIDGSDVEFEQSTHRAFLLHGAGFIYPHSSPGLIVSKYLADDARQCLKKNQSKYAAESLNMLKELGEHDIYSFKLYEDLLKEFPDGFEHYAKEVADAPLPFGTLSLSAAGIVATMAVSAYTNSILILATGLLASFAAIGMAIYRMNRIN